MPDFDLTKIKKRSEIKSLAIILLHFAFVFTPVYLAAIADPGWLDIVLWLWFGFSMNGLLNLLHECGHSHVFKNRTANDILGRWIVGALAVADFDSYRYRHWEHHRQLGRDGDPKKTYHSEIRGWKCLVYGLQCMFLVEGFKRFAMQPKGGAENVLPSALETLPRKLGLPIWMVRVAFVQAVFFASLFVVALRVRPGRLWDALLSTMIAYGIIYIYGLTSVTVLAAGIRAIAEHQIGTSEVKVIGKAALRNFSCNPVSRMLFGAYGFGEHATHHQEPAIPYYHLVAATKQLADEDEYLKPKWGYISTLKELVLAPVRRLPPDGNAQITSAHFSGEQ